MLESVEAARIVAKYFFDDRRVNVTTSSHVGHQVLLLGSVLVRII